MSRTKAELIEELREVKFQSLRMETALLDLRKRNGDLANALNEIDPEAMSRITPERSTFTRFNRISKLVDAVHRLHTAGYTCQSDDKYAVEVFDGAVRDLDNYYKDHFAGKKQLSPEHLAAMKAGREKVS